MDCDKPNTPELICPPKAFCGGEDSESCPVHGENSEATNIEVRRLIEHPKHRQAIKLLQEVWDEWSKSRDKDKDPLVQSAWEHWTDRLHDLVRGEM